MKMFKGWRDDLVVKALAASLTTWDSCGRRELMPKSCLACTHPCTHIHTKKISKCDKNV